MKAKFPSILCVLIPLFLLWTVSAAGGSSDDPLVSLSFLYSTYRSAVDQRVEEKLDLSDQTLRDLPASPATTSSAWTESLLKERDAFTSPTGASTLVLAGDLSVSYDTGAVVDATDGSIVPSGSRLIPRHRYLTAEDTAAVYTVSSVTAVVQTIGAGSFVPSDAVDYNAIASALKTLHLFQGTTTGYGQGFDLDLAPTRLQAMIMFIRVLGEEEAALAWNQPSPFSDVPDGSLSAKYLGYAYANGYTNGYTATTYRPSQTISASQYTEFMLRALGYSSAANTNLSDTLDRAVAAGVLRDSERSLLQTSPFLRAQLVYVSFCALDATPVNASITLRQSLMNRGVFSLDESAVADLAANQRLQ